MPLQSIRLSRVFSAMLAVSFLAGSATAAEQAPATASQYVAPDGKSYFALVLEAQSLKQPRENGSHVVLFDTSASQTGAHRAQAWAVLDAFLAALPQGDTVCLYGVDVSAKMLTKSFVSPGSEELDHALTQLRRRVPGGATDIQKAIQSGLNALDRQTRGSLVYIGDGMSTERLVSSHELDALTKTLVERQIPVHSYAVGPQTDLQLLGALAQRTGGIVLIDHGTKVVRNGKQVRIQEDDEIGRASCRERV